MHWLQGHPAAIIDIMKCLGIVLFLAGLSAFFRAPGAARRRSIRESPPPGAVSAYVDISADRRQRDLLPAPVPEPDAERLARGLTDFYRIRAALGALAGLVLLVVSLVAGATTP